MARVKKTSRGKKYDWMQTSVKLKWTTAASGASPFSDSVYVDVAQCLSNLNRKLVRQGQLFRIRNLKVYTNETSPSMTLKVGAIPTTWVTRNAWVKSKALWDEMNAQASQDVSGMTIYPKYHDYKIYMDDNHRTENQNSGADPNLLPVDFEDNVMTGGDWDYSQFHDSGSVTDSYYVHMLGDHTGSTGQWTSVGLIEAYAESRTRPKADITMNDQEVDSAIEFSPWARLFGDDAQTQTVISGLENKNDDTPYDRVNYVGGANELAHGVVHGFAKIQNLNSVSGSGLTSLAPSFIAPCGLIRLELDAESSTNNTEAIHISFDVDILGPMDM